MEIKVFKQGSIRTNCCLVYNKKTQAGLIIDPAIFDSELKDFISKNKIKLEYILLTHGHFDHVTAVKDVQKIFPKLKIAMHLADLPVVKRYHGLALAAGYGRVPEFEIDIELIDQQVLNIAGFKIQVIATPGHSPGGVCFYFEADKVLFSGDTMFYHVCGRVDLPESDPKAMQQSLQKLLNNLPAETRVLPGHGKETTIEKEKIFYNN